MREYTHDDWLSLFSIHENSEVAVSNQTDFNLIEEISTLKHSYCPHYGLSIGKGLKVRDSC